MEPEQISRPKQEPKVPSSGEEPPLQTTEIGISRRGKAPPVDSFSGEKAELHFEDWLPSLERATKWNISRSFFNIFSVL